MSSENASDERGSLQTVERAVIADQSLQERLGACATPDAFEAQLRLIAGDLGIDLGPAGLSSMRPSPILLEQWPTPGWLPARSVAGTVEPSFDWTWFGTDPLPDIFDEGAVRQAVCRPFSRMLPLRTSLSAMRAGYRLDAAPTAPAGFICHMSRCGSTLLARMLQVMPGVVVASEPEPFDAVLQWAAVTSAPQEDRIEAVRAVAAALGRTSRSESGGFIIKLDCWHTPALPLLRAAFPDVPWLFLYRDPIEVMVSLQRIPGLQVVPGMLDARLFADPIALSQIEYGARALAAICEAALRHFALGGGMLVNYEELHEALAERIPRHFGLDPAAGGSAALAAVGAQNAKDRHQIFSPDGEAKQAAASAAVRAATEQHIRPVYDQLEALRRNRL